MFLLYIPSFSIEISNQSIFPNIWTNIDMNLQQFDVIQLVWSKSDILVGFGIK